MFTLIVGLLLSGGLALVVVADYYGLGYIATDQNSVRSGSSGGIFFMGGGPNSGK